MFHQPKAQSKHYMELELETSIKAEIEEAEKLIAMIGGEKLQLTDSLGQMMVC